MIEPIAERWLLPRLAHFTAPRPDIAVEIETDHAGIGPDRQDIDVWIAFTGDARVPDPEFARHETCSKIP